ncbi:MAG: helix-turn-helix transcriptional regulator [Candidatus Micrarchaeaceae archaeon]
MAKKAIKAKKGSMEHYMTKDMYHMIMKLVILGEIKKKKVYSYELINHVAIHVPKYRSSKNDVKNDVYNTLAMLEKLGYVSQKKTFYRDRVRNFYTLTKKGAMALAESKKIMSKAMADVTKQLRG